VKSLESYKLMSKARAKRNEGDVKLRKTVGVEVLGMTTCPCAMETIRNKIPGLAGDANTPSITHNQRNRTSLVIDTPEGCDVEADDLIQMVEESISSPTYEILKRDDEAEVTIQAHRNPRFVEDVVREILARLTQKYKHMPDDVIISAKSESEESIHKHNAFAERTTTLGELRKG
ncbi:MAG: GTP cyclohydrolase I FolE2, partial [Thermoplasmata archaeon]|nr:GTP cyclohydrolase I FolE2 [Thermoplasmata archaeon]